MVFNFSKYSFRGIQDLCRKYHRQIVASPDKNNLKSVLDGRRVRFINPLGEFDYAYFGEFTFDGDVVSYKGYTSFVRYFSDSLVPSLAGDNCDVQFERNGDMHKEGTVFSNIKPTLFKLFTIENLYWPTNQYVPYGISRDEVIERTSKAKSTLLNWKQLMIFIIQSKLPFMNSCNMHIIIQRRLLSFAISKRLWRLTNMKNKRPLCNFGSGMNTKYLMSSCLSGF